MPNIITIITQLYKRITKDNSKKTLNTAPVIEEVFVNVKKKVKPVETNFSTGYFPNGSATSKKHVGLEGEPMGQTIITQAKLIRSKLIVPKKKIRVTADMPLVMIHHKSIIVAPFLIHLGNSRYEQYPIYRYVGTGGQDLNSLGYKWEELMKSGTNDLMI